MASDRPKNPLKFPTWLQAAFLEAARNPGRRVVVKRFLANDNLRKDILDLQRLCRAFRGGVRKFPSAIPELIRAEGRYDFSCRQQRIKQPWSAVDMYLIAEERFDPTKFFEEGGLV